MTSRFRHFVLRPRSAALLAAALCSGCAVGPDFKRPIPPEANRYTREAIVATTSAPVSGGESQRFLRGVEVQQQWWKQFGSPILDELIEQSFKNNPTIDAAKAALRQAHENTAAQFGAFFPVVQASYSPSRQKNPVGTIAPALSSGVPLYTLHTAQLSVGYVLDVFGANRRAVESLAAQEEAQHFQLQAAYLTLASNVASAAIQEAALRAQIAAATEIVESNRRALALMRRQAELGAVSDLDVAAQESALAQAEQILPPMNKQLDQTRNLISVLAGKLPSQGGFQPFDLSLLKLPGNLPISLPSRLVQNRPDVRAAEAQLHAAGALVGVAVANRLPQFSILGLFGGTSTAFANMFSGDNKFWGVAGNTAQTIFDFGSLKHRQLAAEAAMDQAGAQYRNAVLTAFQNVADSLHALQEDARALAAAVKSEMATKKTLDLSRRQFELGAINALSLFVAEQGYQQAVMTRIQAQASRHTDTVALFLALGGGWQEEPEAVSRDTDRAIRFVTRP